MHIRSLLGTVYRICSVRRQAALGRLKVFKLSASAYPDNNKESSLYCLKQLLEQLLHTPGEMM